MGADYGSLGLDSQLRSLDSFPNRQGTANYTTQTEFDVQNEGLGATMVQSGGFRGKIYIGSDKNIMLDGPNNRITVGTDQSNPLISINGTSQMITVGTNNRIEIDAGNQRILMKDTSDVNRILLDSQNGDFKLSQSGNNVLTCTDDKLIWSSDFNSFKIVQAGTATVNIAGAAYAGTTVTAHNLGYIPGIQGYLTLASGTNAPLPYVTPQATDPITFSRYWRQWVDATNVTSIYHRGTSITGNESYTYKYFLTREIAN